MGHKRHDCNGISSDPPSLLCTAGPLRGQTFPLEKDVTTLGRTETNDIQVENPHVSRQHARIIKAEQGYRIIDLESRNGFTVNKQKIDERTLSDGDEIGIEDSLFIFRSHPGGNRGTEGGSTPILSDEQRNSMTSIRVSLPLSDDLTHPAPMAEPGLIEQLQQRMEMLHRTAELINSEIDKSDLSRRVAELLVEYFNTERACVLPASLDGNGGKPLAVAVRNDATDRALSLSRTIVEQAMREESALLCSDAISDSRFAAANSVQGLSIRSVMCAPLKTRGKPLGLLYLDNRSLTHDFDEDDLRLLRIVACQTAIVFENFDLVSALKNEVAVLHEQVKGSDRGILGESPSIGKVVKIARKAATSNATILILGQSGTGKEVLARNIHHWSDRQDQPFVVVNCATLSDELLQSELFGHERGAFTGAVKQKKGKLELADGGTVFLDEIGEMKPETQARLLRFLQEREFERVGDTRLIKVDVRVLAATNRDLAREVNQGRFREDLYYRLRVIELLLPPLAERRDDIPLLANHFLDDLSRETKRPLEGFSDQALTLLINHPWPGNVRELKNAIERAVVLCSGKRIDAEDLNLEPACGYAGKSIRSQGFHDQVKALKQLVIQSALDENNGVKTDAAKQLGLQLSYLSRLMKNLGMR